MMIWVGCRFISYFIFLVLGSVSSQNVTISPKSHYDVNGTQVTFQCNVERLSTWTITFVYDSAVSNGQIPIYTFSNGSGCNPGLNAPETYSYRCDLLNGIFYVTINPIVLTNNVQTITCEAFYDKNNQKSDVATIALKVPMKAVVLRPENGIKASENGVTNASCKVESNPLADIKWYKVDGNDNLSEITTFAASSTFQNNYTRISWLAFQYNRSDNGGILYCTAKNIFSTKNSSILLNISYPPSAPLLLIRNQEGIVVDNSTLSMICMISGGNPFAKLTWKCKELLMQAEDKSNSTSAISVLTITVNSSYHHANCVCTANHPINGFTVSTFTTIEVIYSPTEQPYIEKSPSSNVTAGSNVSLTCILKGGNPLAVLKWNCSGMNTNLTDGDMASYRVEFKVEKEDNGKTCACSALHLIDSFGLSIDVQLEVYYIPDSDIKVIQISRTPIYDGDNVTLKCSVSGGNPFPSLEWNCTGSLLDSKNGSITEKFLELTATRAHNSETCTCTGKHFISTYVAQANYKLNVYYAPGLPALKFEPSLPWFEGNTTSITCESDDGNPKSNFLWLINEKRNSSSNELTFKNITRKYNGYSIRCIVSNAYTTHTGDIYHSATSLIDVEFYPEVNLEETKIYVIEGKALKTSCKAFGNPLPDVQWIFNYTSIKESSKNQSTLQFPNVNRNKNGSYICKATSKSDKYGNLVGEKYLDIVVYYPPEVWIQLNKTNTNQDYAIVLICLADGYPTNYTFKGWSHSYGNTYIQRFDKGSSVVDGNGQILKLDKLTYEDNGNYTCTVTNDIPGKHGDIDQTGYVEVGIPGPPTLLHINSVDNVYATEKGGNITIDIVFFSLLDFKALWFNMTSNSSVNVETQRTIIQTSFHGVSINISEHTYRTTQYLINFQTYQQGKYALVVENGIDTKSFVFKTVISGPPEEPRDVQVVNITLTSLTLTWKRGFNGGHAQTFIISYFESKTGDTLVLEENDQSAEFQAKTINGLHSSTNYIFTLCASNAIGKNCFPDIINATTSELIEAFSKDNKRVIIGITSGLGSACFVIVCVGVVYYFRRSRFEKLKNKSQKIIHERDNENKNGDDGLKDNILYMSADNVSPTLNKSLSRTENKTNSQNNETALYASVQKEEKSERKDKQITKTRKNNKNNTESKEAEKVKKPTSKGDIYENISPSLDGITNKILNKDGLRYAELVFNPSTVGPKFVIHGLEDRTIYAEVDTTKKIEPLPESDTEDDGNNKQHEDTI